MKVFIIFLLSLSIFYQQGLAQKKAQPVSKITAVKKDSMAGNIISCIKKLQSMIANPTVKGSDFAARYLYTDDEMNRYYYAKQPLNGAAASYMIKGGTVRSWKQTVWTYNCLLGRMAAGSDKERLAKAYSLVDSLLKTLSASANNYAPNTIAKTEIKYAAGSAAMDSLFFSVTFNKEPEGDREKIGDSVINFYLRGLKNPVTQKSAFQQLKKAMDQDDLRDHAFRTKYISLINSVAADNFDGAVDIFLNAPFYDEKIMIADLDPSLHTKMHDRMDKIVNDYRTEQDRVYREKYLGEKPVSASETAGYQYNEEKKRQCEENRQNMRYQIGQRLTGPYSSYEYFITGFDCIAKKYAILERRYYPGKKTFFKTDGEIGHYELNTISLPEDVINSRYHATGERYEICTRCNGSGIGSSTQVRTAGGWEQTNFNVYTYTDPRVVAEWKQREVCSQCGGSGMRKVQ